MTQMTEPLLQVFRSGSLEEKRQAHQRLLIFASENPRQARSLVQEAYRLLLRALTNWDASRVKNFSLVWWLRRLLADVSKWCADSGAPEIILSHLLTMDPCDCFTLEIIEHSVASPDWYRDDLLRYAADIMEEFNEERIFKFVDSLTSLAQLAAKSSISEGRRLLEMIRPAQQALDNLGFSKTGSLIMAASRIREGIEHASQVLALEPFERVGFYWDRLRDTGNSQRPRPFTAVTETDQEFLLARIADARAMAVLPRLYPDCLDAVKMEIHSLFVAERAIWQQVCAVHGMLELIDFPGPNVGETSFNIFHEFQDELQLGLFQHRETTVNEFISEVLSIA